MAKKIRVNFTKEQIDLFNNTEARYVKAVQDIFTKATAEATRIGVSIANYNPARIFSFDDYPQTKKRVDQLLANVAADTRAKIEEGTRKEWLHACKVNDALVKQISATSRMSTEAISRLTNNNLPALAAFQGRKIGGMGLSDRVWKYTNQFKQEIEMGLDIGLGEATPAGDLAKQMKQYLQEPEKLFRRVRDKHGNLKLSQNAKAYHPGQGVYRSSYRNAARLARTEVNMAYREAEHQRWTQLDFVIGIEIRLSNNHTLNGRPFVDICDSLKGRYPKNYKFKGWHPQCRCHAIPILAKEGEFIEWNEEGGVPGSKEFTGTIKETPSNFNSWMQSNQTKIATAKNLPWFLTDNASLLGVQPQNVVTNIAAKAAKTITPALVPPPAPVPPPAAETAIPRPTRAPRAPKRAPEPKVIESIPALPPIEITENTINKFLADNVYTISGTPAEKRAKAIEFLTKAEEMRQEAHVLLEQAKKLGITDLFGSTTELAHLQRMTAEGGFHPWRFNDLLQKITHRVKHNDAINKLVIDQIDENAIEQYIIRATGKNQTPTREEAIRDLTDAVQKRAEAKRLLELAKSLNLDPTYARLDEMIKNPLASGSGFVWRNDALAKTIKSKQTRNLLEAKAGEIVLLARVKGVDYTGLTEVLANPRSTMKQIRDEMAKLKAIITPGKAKVAPAKVKLSQKEITRLRSEGWDINDAALDLLEADFAGFDLAQLSREFDAIGKQYNINWRDKIIQNYTSTKVRILYRGDTTKGPITLKRLFEKRNGKLVVEHEYFHVPEKLQGNGMSRDIFKAYYKQYKAAKTHTIKVHANINVGGYTWGRYGFSTSKSEAEDFLQIWRGIKNPAFAERIRKAEMAFSRHFTTNPNSALFPMDKWAEIPGVKELLLGTDWYGSIDLTSAARRKVFEDYLFKK